MKWNVSILSVMAITCFGVNADPEPINSISDVAGVGTVDRATNASGSRVELNSIKDSSTVALRVASSLSDADKDGRAFFSGWSITASAPLNKSESNTDLVTLDGLHDSFSLGVGYTRLKFRKMKSPQSNPRAKAIRDEICDLMRINFKKRTNSSDEVVKGRVCSSNSVKLDVPDRHGQYKDLFLEPGGFQTQWGIEAKIGQKTFDYRDPVSFEKESDSKLGSSLKAFYNILPANSLTMIGFGVELQRVYEPALTETRCPGGGPVTCQTGSFAEPGKVDKELVFLEIRRKFANKGVSLKITYDNESDVTAIDLPIYLIQDKKQNLNGGIRIGHRDDLDDIEFGIFVGGSFNIFD